MQLLTLLAAQMPNCGIYFRDVNSIHHKRRRILDPPHLPHLHTNLPLLPKACNNKQDLMEKSKEASEQKKSADLSAANSHGIWDCGSSLYDSFELKALEKQLDSAIASRSLSMPHLSDRGGLPRPAPPLQKKPSSRISRSFQKLIRAVFRPKNNSSGNNYSSGGGFHGFYDRSGALSTIPEGSEFDGLSPELRSLVTRTASERFTAATSVGISCS